MENNILISRKKRGETRWYLVKKEDRKQIVVDFWEKFGVDSVEEINESKHHLIEVCVTDSNDNECIKLINFNGRTVVDSCLEYEFIGNNNREIKVLQYGYMNDVHYDLSDNEFWSIVDSQEIEGVNSIEYSSEHKVFIIDEKFLYNDDLTEIGRRVDDFEGEYLVFSNEKKLKGIFFKGFVIIEAEYESLNLIESDYYTLIKSRINDETGIFVLKNGEILLKKGITANKIVLIYESENIFFFLFKVENRCSLFILGFDDTEVIYDFDDFFEIESNWLDFYTPAFCGTDTLNNATYVFIIHPEKTLFHDEEISRYYQIKKFDGCETQEILSSLFSLRKI